MKLKSECQLCSLRLGCVIWSLRRPSFVASALYMNYATFLCFLRSEHFLHNLILSWYQLTDWLTIQRSASLVICDTDSSITPNGFKFYFFFFNFLELKTKQKKIQWKAQRTVLPQVFPRKCFGILYWNGANSGTQEEFLPFWAAPRSGSRDQPAQYLFLFWSAHFSKENFLAIGKKKKKILNRRERIVGRKVALVGVLD